MHHDIHLGITGLRRTGKTVFLTSLIYQLKERGSAGLNAFENKGVKLLPAKIVSTDDPLPPFPYEDNLKRLKMPVPAWPERSVSEFACTLELSYEAGRYASKLRKWPLAALGMARDRGTLRLHLHDYPGEFLLDTPMMGQSYDKWATETIVRMRLHCSDVAEAYVTRASAIGDATSVASESAVAELRTTYGRYLGVARCRGMEMLQPGIALAALGKPFDEVTEWTAGALPFVPLPDQVSASHPLRSEMKMAFEKYRTGRVEPFARRLHRNGRQIVLVDILRILRNGVECFNDTQECLATIMEAYRRNLAWRAFAQKLPRPVRPRSHISRIVFAATKADHALKSHRANLRLLLEDIVRKAEGRLAKGVGPMFHEWFSSLRCTKDRDGTVNGRPAEALLGRLRGEDGGKPPIPRNPGVVPIQWPQGGQGDEWPFGCKRFAFPEFEPESLRPRDGVPWQQMNLDALLWTVLGDCFLVQK